MPWSSEILLSVAMAPEFILSFTDAELQCDLTALHKDLELFVCGKCYLLSFSKFQFCGSLY